MGVRFLNLDEVLSVHRDGVATFGGTDGIRDPGLLHSALAMPQAAFGGAHLHADLYEMAAAYVFHIVKNHPFLDLNKRTGALAAVVFLEMNGVDMDVPEIEFQNLVLDVAAGAKEKQDLVEFLRRNLPPLPEP